jgi:hypothetical protein
MTTFRLHDTLDFCSAELSKINKNETRNNLVIFHGKRPTERRLIENTGKLEKRDWNFQVFSH